MLHFNQTFSCAPKPSNTNIFLFRFKFIPDDEAVIALREQAQRYNGRRRKKRARLSFGESKSRRMSRDSEFTNPHNDKLDSSVPLPDYLKAKIDREEDIRKKGGVVNTISNNALKWQNTFTIDAKDIVQVQPATHIDPFSKEGEKLVSWFIVVCSVCHHSCSHVIH